MNLDATKIDELRVTVGRGLANAVRVARADGATWDAIGSALGTTRQAAQQRFGFVDDELRRTGHRAAVVRRSAEESAEVLQPVATAAEADKAPVEYDFQELKSMSEAELSVIAASLAGDLRHRKYMHEEVALREAIIITLYNREKPQTEIAELFGVSHQRINQIVKSYFDRMERAWEQERRARQGRA